MLKNIKSPFLFLFLPVLLAFAFLLLSGGSPASAAGGKVIEKSSKEISDFFQHFLFAMKGKGPIPLPTPGTQFDWLSPLVVPGLNAAMVDLSRRADNPTEEKTLATALANEVIWQSSRQGCIISRISKANDCLGPLLLEPDAFIHSDQAAVRMAIGHVRLVGRQEPMRNLNAQGISVGPVGWPKWARRAMRKAVVDVLEEALDHMRKKQVNEENFQAIAIKKLVNQTTKAPKSDDLQSITYDDAKGTLNFIFNIDKTKVSVKELNVKLYLKRLKSLLVFSGSSAGGTPSVLLSTDDSSQLAKQSRKEQVQVLMVECKQAKFSMKLRPPQCGTSLTQADLTTINRESLIRLVCEKHTTACDN